MAEPISAVRRQVHRRASARHGSGSRRRGLRKGRLSGVRNARTPAAPGAVVLALAVPETAGHVITRADPQASGPAPFAAGTGVCGAPYMWSYALSAAERGRRPLGPSIRPQLCTLE